MKQIFSITLILFATFFLTVNAGAAIYIVTNTNDAGAGSLRQAIIQADATTDEDVIKFDEQEFGTPKTIILTSGQLNPFYSVVIDGPGANLLTISGNNQSRIFFNNFSNAVLTVKNLTLTQGFAANGGAILASCTLKLSDLVITGNKAAGAEATPAGFAGGLGGGIYSTGSLTIINSTVSNNLASGVIIHNTTNPAYGDGGTAGGGGGIFSYGFESIIVNCTFANNMAKGISSPDAGAEQSGNQGGAAYGGALYGIFNFKIINSRFINNSAASGNGASIVSTTFGLTAGSGGAALGGAVYSSGTRILNSTFNGNSAVSGNGGNAPAASAAGVARDSSGGGIRDGDLKMANSTVVNNTAIAGSGRIGGSGSGGGIYGGSNQWSVINSTITGNSVTGGTGTETNGASQGGGVFSGSDTGPASAFHNNIVAENSAAAGTDVFGTYINPANNLIRIGEGATGLMNGVNGNLVGTIASPINPLLAPLGNNGGVTETRALLAGSPAVNAGNNTRAINPFNFESLQFDQRNFQRIAPIGGVIDMGSFEFAASSVPVTNSPDLQNASDTGLSNTDNITRATAPVFDVLNVVPGATVELLRNGAVVSSASAVLFSVSLTDPSPPLDGVVQYSSRQTIGGTASAVSSSLSVTFDNTPPAVTIKQFDQQTDPAIALPIRFTALFSEPVGGFDGQDISLANSTADVSGAFATVSATAPGTYVIEVYGIRSPGQVVVTIPAGAAYDYALNYSSSPTYQDNNVIFQPGIARVAVSGRVIKNSGLVKTSSTVTFTDNFTGETWTARTNPFGYYSFTGLPIYLQIGRRFSVRINNKSFIYNAPQIVTITANRNNLNYTVP